MGVNAKGFSNMVNNMARKAGVSKIASNMAYDGGITGVMKGSVRRAAHKNSKAFKRVEKAARAAGISEAEISSGMRKMKEINNNLRAVGTNKDAGFRETFKTISDINGGGFKGGVKTAMGAGKEYFYDGASKAQMLTRIGAVGAAGAVGAVGVGAGARSAFNNRREDVVS